MKAAQLGVKQGSSANSKPSSLVVGQQPPPTQQQPIPALIASLEFAIQVVEEQFGTFANQVNDVLAQQPRQGESASNATNQPTASHLGQALAVATERLRNLADAIRDARERVEL